MEGEVIVARPKSSSDCMEGEGDLAIGAGIIWRPFAASMVGARDRGRTVISLGSLWEPVYNEH